MTFMKLSVACVLAIALLRPAGAEAQLAAAGPSGVVMGHIHVVGRDLDAHRRFWTALGGVAMKNGTLEMIAFPGAFVNLRQVSPRAARRSVAITSLHVSACRPCCRSGGWG